MKKYVLTPFRFIYPIMLVTFALSVILNKWCPLYFLVIGAFIVDFLLLLLIDYLLIHFFGLKIIWLCEILFIAVLLLLKLYYQLNWYDMILEIF